MGDQKIDGGKRTWIIASGCAGAVGAGFVAVPFVSSFEPSERARAAGAPVEVDISGIQPGEKITVAWRGKPVWIVRRTPEQLAELPKVDGELADPQSKRNQFLDHAGIRQERLAIDQDRVSRRHRHLHPSRLLAGRQVHAGPAAFAARRLAGRLPLPLPRLDVRHVGPRLQGQAGSRQSRSPALHVPVRQPDPHRRREEGLSLAARPDRRRLPRRKKNG